MYRYLIIIPDIILLYIYKNSGHRYFVEIIGILYIYILIYTGFIRRNYHPSYMRYNYIYAISNRRFTIVGISWRVNVPSIIHHCEVLDSIND